MLLYKYRSLAPGPFENIVSDLENGTIYCSTHTELNDPFEYSYRWTVDGPFDEKVEFWRKQDKHYSDALAGKSADQQLKEITAWEDSISVPHGPNMLGLDDVGVYCLSKSWDIIPMWSLYADSHRGICLEFETDDCTILAKANDREVTYIDDPAPYNLYRGVVNVNDVLMRKYRDWSFEKEHRLFLPKGPQQFNTKALRSVIFGSKVLLDGDNRDRFERIRGFVKERYPHVVLRRAIRTHGYFKFKLEEVL